MPLQIRTLKELALAARSDDLLLSRLRADPVAVLREMAEVTSHPTRHDRLIYRIIVSVLGMVVLLTAGVAAYAALRPTGAPIPDVLTTLGAAAAGALVGLLAPSPMLDGDD